MKKKEFIRRLAEKGYSKKAAAVVAEDFIDTLFECLQDGEKVLFSKFGTFEVVERAGHMGTNPQTHEKQMVDAYKMPKFTAGQPLIDAIRNQK